MSVTDDGDLIVSISSKSPTGSAFSFDIKTDYETQFTPGLREFNFSGVNAEFMVSDYYLRKQTDVDILVLNSGNTWSRPATTTNSTSTLTYNPAIDQQLL